MIFPECCVPGTMLGARSEYYRGSKPKRSANKNIFKTSYMQKGSFSISGQLLNTHFIMEPLELRLGLPGGSRVLHFRSACTVGFVAVMLFQPEVSVARFLRTACCKHPTLSVHKKDEPSAERRKDPFLSLS